MPRSGLKIHVFGSSLTSAFWNGAATYYRGIYRGLHALGYCITFAEPDILERQKHRDWPVGTDPPFAHCPLYGSRAELDQHLRRARHADVIVKHSGIGAEDEYLEMAVLDAAEAAPAGARPQVIYWDVDMPATLAALTASAQHSLRGLLPRYDFVFFYGGGPKVVECLRQLGVRRSCAIYNGLDPDTHHPAQPQAQWRADLSFLGHRLPDREQRVRSYLFRAADICPHKQFLLAGEGWLAHSLPPNLRTCGYVGPQNHNVLNSSAGFVLNLNREAMAAVGFCPPTRIFEAAGAAAAVISDPWPGIGAFFEPGREILVASDAQTIAGYLDEVSPEAARRLGMRARDRALAEHTYQRRAQRVHHILHGSSGFYFDCSEASATPAVELAAE